MHLVTGGAGFAGSSFVRHAMEHIDDEVVVLAKLTYAGACPAIEEMPAARVELVVGEVCRIDLVDRPVAASEVVAAESHDDISVRYPSAFIHTNVVGSFTLLVDVRRHDRRLRHVSTDEVSGDLRMENQGRSNDAPPHRPSSPCSATKAFPDHVVRAWARPFGIRATSTKCSNNYGPFEHVEKSIPRQIANGLTGARPRRYGKRFNVRVLIHGEDHSSALCGLEMLPMFFELMGRPTDEFDHVTDRPGRDRRYAIDGNRMRHELAWEPLHRDIRNGLTDTIAWCSQNRRRCVNTKSKTVKRYHQVERLL